MVKIRANRDKPGLRPQHHKAVEAAATLGAARVTGNSVGSRELTFSPATYSPRDLTIDIGTAGSTGLVLQTLQLALALNAERPIQLALTGGTFNPKAPPFPFLQETWNAYLAAFGMPLTLTMPAAGFYPRGGGRLEARIEPATPRAFVQTQRGPLRRVWGTPVSPTSATTLPNGCAATPSSGLRNTGFPPRSKSCAGPARGRGPRFI